MRTDYYVYVKVCNSQIVYIGKGTGKRDESVSGRSDELVAIWDRCGHWRIREGLTEAEAFSLEGELIQDNAAYLMNRIGGLTPPKRISTDLIPPKEALRRKVGNATGARTPTPDEAVAAMVSYLNGFARQLNILIVCDRDARIYAGVKDLGHNITLVDDDLDNAYVLDEATTNNWHATFSGDFLAMPADKKFDVILMNPPFNTKVGKYVKVRNLWKKFADKALLHADEVVTLAPLSARTHGRLILSDNIKFDGNDNPAVVTVWNREAKIDLSVYPKFDVMFKEVSDDGSTTSEADVEVVNFTDGKPKMISKTAAARFHHSGEAAYILFRPVGPNRVTFSNQIMFGPYQITGPDVRKCVEWLDTAEGKALIERITNTHMRGFRTVLTSDKNSKFYNINRIIGRLR